MKKNKTIAAILFGVLGLVQFFGLTYFLGATTAQMPIFAFVEIIALVVYVVVCVKMLNTADVAITSGEKRAASALSVMYLISIALNITLTIQILSLALATINQELASMQTTGIVILCVRTALLIAAMYFTISNEKQAVAVIEFEGGVDASELATEDAVEIITEKLDAVEE